MKKILNILIVLFAIVCSIFTIHANSTYYFNQFDNKPTLTYVVLPEDLQNLDNINEEIKAEIINNNYTIEYIESKQPDIIKYINGNVDSINYYNKVNKTNYITKQLKDENIDFKNKIGFYSNNEANKFANTFIKKYNINKEDILPTVIQQQMQFEPIAKIILLILFIIICYLIFLIIFKNIKEIGINLINGNSKIRSIYNIFKTNLVMIFSVIFLYLLIIIFLNIKLKIFKNYLIFLLLLPIAILILFFITIKYKKINLYLKKEVSTNMLINFSRLLFVIVLVLNFLTISFIPDVINKYNTLMSKKNLLNSVNNISILEYKVTNNTVGPDPIYALTEYNQKVYDTLYQNPYIFQVSQTNIDDNIINIAPELKDIQGNYLVVDEKYLQYNNMQVPNLDNENVLVLDNNYHDYETLILENVVSEEDKPKTIYYDLSGLSFPVFPRSNLDNFETNVNGLYIINSKNVDWRKQNIDALRLIQNEENDKQMDALVKQAQLEDNQANWISLYDVFYQENKYINIYLSSILIITIISTIGIGLLLYILVDLMINAKLKIIMVKKLFGTKFFEIYKFDLILINIFILLTSSIFLINNHNLSDYFITLITIFILINLIIMVLIKKTENKKIINILKQE